VICGHLPSDEQGFKDLCVGHFVGPPGEPETVGWDGEKYLLRGWDILDICRVLEIREMTRVG